MQPYTMVALREYSRKIFCKKALNALKKDGFSVDPNNPQQLSELIDLSKQLDSQGNTSKGLQYCFFMLFTLIGGDFLEDSDFQKQIQSLPDEHARIHHLDTLINRILTDNTSS